MLRHLELDKIHLLKDKIDEQTLAVRQSSRHFCIPVTDGGFFMGFRYYDVAKPLKIKDRIYLYISPDLFCLICDNKRISAILKEIPDDSPGFTALAMFFQFLTQKDVDILEKAEDSITKLEDRLITSKRCNNSVSEIIIKQRRALLKIKRYYSQLNIITGDLLATADNITDKERFALKAVDRRFAHLLNNVMSLREYTTQVREAYQAQIDIEQNQIMKIFTVLTSVFLPLSIIVGWYGMNFDMPEYAWKYGYLYVIGLSIIAVTVCIFIFTRKKLY